MSESFVICYRCPSCEAEWDVDVRDFEMECEECGKRHVNPSYTTARKLLDLLKELEEHATMYGGVPRSADLLWGRVRDAIAEVESGDR